MRILAQTITLTEFLELMKDYDQDELDVAMARVAVEGQEKARADVQERAHLESQEHARLQERELENLQEQVRAGQADTRSRRSSADLTQPSNYQLLIRSLREDQRALEAILEDEEIFSRLREVMNRRN